MGREFAKGRVSRISLVAFPALTRAPQIPPQGLSTYLLQPFFRYLPLEVVLRITFVCVCPCVSVSLCVWVCVYVHGVYTDTHVCMRVEVRNNFVEQILPFYQGSDSGHQRCVVSRLASLLLS